MSDFIFTIEISSRDQSFTLPLKEVVDNRHEFEVDWGDKSSSSIKSFDDENVTHKYSDEGKYTISIKGNCPWFSFNHEGDRTLLTSIDSWGDVGMVNLNGGFYGCTNLTSIASDGEGLKNVTDFTLCFCKCSMSLIPVGLFDYCTKATIFKGCFQLCSITSIPRGLFNACVEVVDFSSCFSYCKMNAIPVGLFDGCVKVTDFNSCFAQCDGLTIIPSGLFNGCTEVKDFTGIFCGCTELKEVPSGLFDVTIKATNFAVSFSNCEKLDTVASTVFKNYTTDKTDFKNVFYKCDRLVVKPTPGTAINP